MRYVHPMNAYDEMKAYVGFDARDAERLRALWPVIEPRANEVIDEFYAAIARSPARSVIRSDAQAERLRATLYEWMRELLLGPHDRAYYERRERIGSRHVTVNLPSRFMYTAMSVVRNKLCSIAHSVAAPEQAHDFCLAIDKVTSIDLAIMTGTYISSRQQEDLATLQDVLVRHLPSNVVLVDGTGRITAGTRASFSPQDCVGMPWETAFPPELTATLRDVVERTLAAGVEVVEPRCDVEVDGRMRNFRVSVVPVEHDLARFLIHVEEISEAVQVEARLRRTESLASLGALSAAVAHELRNPLAGISAAIQVISRTLPVDDRRRGVMDKIEGQIRRLDVLSTDLLSFARPDTARPVSVNLEERVRAAAQVLEPFPEVVWRCQGRGRAWADPDLLHHLLANIFQNAAQALGGAGQIHIDIQGSTVIISDSGPGIPDEIRAEIFKPFFTTRTRGTGLGLAIVQKAANAMNGTVALTRGALPGAGFAVRLPADRTRTPNEAG